MTVRLTVIIITAQLECNLITHGVFGNWIGEILIKISFWY